MITASPSNHHQPSRRELNSAELQEELRVLGGTHKVRMNHAAITPEIVIRAIHEYLSDGRIPDAFDGDAIAAFRDIPEIRHAVEQLLESGRKKDVAVSRLPRPEQTLPLSRPPMPLTHGNRPLIVMPADLEEAMFERVKQTKVLDADLFERRRGMSLLNNQKLPYHVKREVATIHADLASVEGAQEAFRLIYKFSIEEIIAWTPPVLPQAKESPAPVEPEAIRDPVPSHAPSNGHANGDGVASRAPSESPVVRAPAAPRRMTVAKRRDEDSIDQRAPSAIKNAEVLASVKMVVRGDPEMEKAWHLSQLYAKGSMIMLYRGERGTGKELFPRAVHQLQEKNAGPFVVQNCAAVSSGIIESELFGHEKGAFTDARVEREGIFGQVKDGGTILLDEIGDMPLEQQAKLLRVLENRTWTRVGGNKEFTMSPKTKIIAATNRNLEELVAQKLFRADLYDRLRGCQIFIPPLRNRHPDHRGALVDHLLAKYGQLDCPVRLSSEAREYVMSLDYPGNVRELRDHMERAVLIAQAEAPLEINEIEISLSTVRVAEDVPLASIVSAANGKLISEALLKGTLIAGIPERPKRADATVDFSVHLAAIDGNITEIVYAIESVLCGVLLKRLGGNQSKVSQVTGITRGSVRDRLRKLRVLGSVLNPPDDDDGHEPDAPQT